MMRDRLTRHQRNWNVVTWVFCSSTIQNKTTKVTANNVLGLMDINHEAR